MSSEKRQNGAGCQTDETDAWLMKRKNREAASDDSDVQDAAVLGPDPGCDPNAEEYYMSHPRRGVALIFNHTNFHSMEQRNGTNKDCAELSRVLRDLRFSVRDYHDLTYKQLRDKLENVASEDHSDADCLLIAVLTHGDPGVLHTKDQPYPVQELWQRFLGDRCLSLAAKPKIFIIQACRGVKVDKGVQVRTETDSVSSYFTIPAHSDILIAYSTVEGHYSWRSPRDGSWFIQALVEELRINGTRRDLQTILTFVNRRVALNKLSFVPNNPDMDQKKQSPAFTSMLTRLVYFR